MIPKIRMTAICSATALVFCAGCSSSFTQKKSSDLLDSEAAWVGDQTVSSPADINEFSTLDENGKSNVVVTGHLTDQYGSEIDASDLVPLSSTPTSSPNLIGGNQLGGSRITATEHALKLRADNLRMRHAGQKLLSDVRNLRQQIARKDELLVRVEDAMSVATEELMTAKAENQVLKKKIAAMESQQRQQEMANERVLSSIRVELDDALMREISSVQE